MRIRNLTAAVALLGLCSCYQLEVSAQAGYAQLALDGDLGYVNGSSSAEIRQDIESAFGLGDDQGSVYGRASVDFGVPTLTASGFLFEDEGQGVLTADFGDNLVANTPVASEFSMANAKVSYVFDISLGPVTVSPGIAADFIDLSMEVRDTLGIVSEKVELQAPIPLAFLRAGLDFGIVGAMVEGGYMQVDIDDVEAKMLDIEALVELRPLDWLNVFAGYRSIQVQAEGLIDEDQADIDIGVSGWLIGGGIRF